MTHAPTATAACHSLGHEGFCDALAAEIPRLAGAVAAADPAARVPTCPDWSVRELAEHVGGVHRWAGQMVRALAPERLRARDVVLDTPEDPSALAGWVREGGERLVEALRAADPEAPMWAWGPDPHARFWARRMLHETAVHRADAELALGRGAEIDPAVAIDGVDEFLDNLPHTASWAPGVAELRGDGERLAFAAAGSGVRWTVQLLADRFTWTHDDSGGAAVRVEAAPGDLVLFVYGRRAPGDAALRVEGDAELLARWVERSSI